MKRGDVYAARLDPAEGSEQAGTRPVIVVRRDAINHSSPVVVVVPCTSYRRHRRIYPSQIVLEAPDGGLRTDSVALGEQIRSVARVRLRKKLGSLAPASLSRLDSALLKTLDLPGQEEL